LIKNLVEYKRLSARTLVREFPKNKHWKRRTLDHFLRKLRITASIERTPGSGRPSPRGRLELPQSQFPVIRRDAVMTSSSH